MNRMYFYRKRQMKLIYLLILIFFFTSCKEKEKLQSELVTSKIDCIVPKSVESDSISIAEIDDSVTVIEIKQKR